MDDKLELLFSGQQYKKLQEFCYEDLLERYDLSIVDIRVLLFLCEHESLDTAKDIVKMRYMAKSYVSKSVDKLIEKGFLERKHMQEDRRYIHLQVKEEALPVVDAALERKEDMIRQIFQGITAEQIEVLKQIAIRVSENIAGMMK